MINPVKIQFTLEKTPFPTRAASAQARMMPLLNENDFEVMASLPTNETRVHLSFADYFELLSKLVNFALTHFPELELILIRVSLPSGIRLDKSLLQDKVLMLQEVHREEERCIKRQKSFLVIEDFICRFRLQDGDNRINLRLYQVDDEHVVGELKHFLTQHGFRERGLCI